VLREATPWRGPSLDFAVLLLAVAIAAAGWRAAFGLFA
jgi:hypothetical protein